MSTFLGVDPGLANCGYAVIEVDSGKAVVQVRGVIKPARRKGGPRSWFESFEYIAGQLEKLVEKYHPAGAAVEQIVWHGPRKGVLALAQLTGAIYGFLRPHMIVRAVLPAWVKENAASGKMTPHEADAIALARYASGHRDAKPVSRKKKKR